MKEKKVIKGDDLKSFINCQVFPAGGAVGLQQCSVMLMCKRFLLLNKRKHVLKVFQVIYYLQISRITSCVEVLMVLGEVLQIPHWENTPLPLLK